MVAPYARKANSISSLCGVDEEAPISSSHVPFKWEEAPGKPIICNGNKPVEYHNSPAFDPLQLPPRLQLQRESLLWKKSHQRIPFKSHHFTQLYKSMQRMSKRRHFQIILNDKDGDEINESENEFAISIDKAYPSIRIYEDVNDVFHQPDDKERKSWSPRRPSKSPSWYPRILGQHTPHHRDNVDERLRKAQRTSHLTASNEALPVIAWTHFNPHNEEAQKTNVGNTASMIFKDIMRKAYKLQKKKDVTAADIWSPTLATYLYNQQKMEEEDNGEFPYLSQDTPLAINGPMFYRSRSLKCYFEDRQKPHHAFVHRPSLSYDEKYGQFDNSINAKEKEHRCKGKHTVTKRVQILVSTIKTIFVGGGSHQRRIVIN